MRIIAIVFITTNLVSLGLFSNSVWWWWWWRWLWWCCCCGSRVLSQKNETPQTNKRKKKRERECMHVGAYHCRMIVIQISTSNKCKNRILDWNIIIKFHFGFCIFLWSLSECVCLYAIYLSCEKILRNLFLLFILFFHSILRMVVVFGRFSSESIQK